MVFKAKLTKQLIQLLMFWVFLLVSFQVQAEVLIVENSKEVDVLPSPGDLTKIEYTVSSNNTKYQYFLLSNFDQQSSFLKPVATERIADGLRLTFELPAPLVDLQYQLLVKQGAHIVAQSEVQKVSRDCLPQVNLEDIEAKDDLTAQYLAEAKQLETDYQNLMQAKLQLNRLRELIYKSGGEQ